jgi:hypothetical protein
VYLYLLCFVLFVLCFLYCFVYVYVFLLVLSVLPPSDNSIAVSDDDDDDNNNNNNKHDLLNLFRLMTATYKLNVSPVQSSGVPRNFVPGGGGSTNSVEDRGQRERGSGGGSPLVRGSTQFTNE